MLEWLWMMKSEIQFGLFGLLFLLSLLRGAAPERLLSGTLLAMFLADRLYHLAAGGSIILHWTDLGHMGIDLAVLVISFAIALRANRIYPLWIGGAQIIAMLAHVYRLSLTEINRFAYDMMSVMPSYIQLAALILGLAFHMSRRKRLGSYPSWRGSFVPTPASDQNPLHGG